MKTKTLSSYLVISMLFTINAYSESKLLVEAIHTKDLVNKSLQKAFIVPTVLPGSFPKTGVFQGPYQQKFKRADIIGNWHMIANGRIYNLDISNKNGKLEVNSRLGPITVTEWNPTIGKFSFQRNRTNHKIINNKKISYNLIQNFTGYLMAYSHETRKPGTQKDYKWRMAGTFTQCTPLIHRSHASWYATRPRNIHGCIGKPNLLVSHASIDFNANTVTVVVKNNGDKDAGNHLTYIEINEIGATAPLTPQTQYSVNIPLIAKGTTWNSGAVPFSQFSHARASRGLDLSTLTSANLVVRVDAKVMVDECNEDDNYYSKNFE